MSLPLHRFGFLIVALPLVACRETPAPAAPPAPAATAPAAVTDTRPAGPLPSPVDEPVEYRCADGYAFHARYDENAVSLRLADDSARVLTQVIAASGAKYEGEQALLWSKGSVAMLEVDGTAHADCREQEPAHARKTVGAFVAQGSEPGWKLEIRPGDSMELRTDDGRTTIRMVAPPALPDGDATVYHARNAQHELSVRVEPVACEEEISGARYAATVQLRLDGRPLRGCGGALIAAPEAG